MSGELKHIELFAGCGGMTLGLEAAGFELYFANELSPMAGETFAYNLLGEDLYNLANKNESSENVLWIKSKYKRSSLKSRLRENPFETKNGEYSDLDGITNLKQKLLVGDIDELLKWLDENPHVEESIRNENITLISGGPPCQSFSLAGRREKNNAKNLLPLSFARFAGKIRPQFVILENVKGITAPFTEEGKKYYAWFEVAKAFSLEGFVPVCMLLNSKYFGVAQNRPRFILLAIRADVADKIYEKHRVDFLTEAFSFYTEVQNNEENTDGISLKSLHYYDIEEREDLYNGFLFPKATTPDGLFISASKAINDLLNTHDNASKTIIRNEYRDNLNEIFKPKLANNEDRVYNHEPRNHSYFVQARFGVYQLINEFKNGNKKIAVDAILGKKIEKQDLIKLTNEISAYEVFAQKSDGTGYKTKLTTVADVEVYFRTIATKKHSQRALKEKEPAPAQLTIPDDLCHYDQNQLRTLTVREMARFQSFPDWFRFRSKVTTGGTSRKFEVPQYTQVGNAVPPLLARALGEVIVFLINEIKEDQ